MNQFYLILLSLFLFSCSQDKKQQEQLVLNGEITFEGVKGYAEYYFFDTLQNKEYLSFFTIRSKEDSLKVFEFPSAKLLYSVPMYDLWDTLNGIQMRTFSMIGVDTFCISSENNVFVFLNKFGEVYKWLDMTPYSEWRNLKLYYNYDFSHPVQSSTKNLYFKIGAEPHDTIGSTMLNSLDKLEASQFARYAGPNLSLIKFDGDSIFEIEYFIPDFRNKLFGKGTYLVLGNLECQFPVNDDYYFASKHRDTVYKLDRKSGELLAKHPIKSKYTNIGFEPCYYKNTGLSGSAMQDCETKNLIKSGFISSMNYYPEKEFFLIGVTHEAPAEIESPNFIDKSFSLILFDKEFNYINEYLFSSKENSSSVIKTQDGFLLKKRGDIKSKIKDENYTYQYYRVL